MTALSAPERQSPTICGCTVCRAMLVTVAGVEACQAMSVELAEDDDTRWGDLDNYTKVHTIFCEPCGRPWSDSSAELARRMRDARDFALATTRLHQGWAQAMPETPEETTTMDVTSLH